MLVAATVLGKEHTMSRSPVLTRQVAIDNAICFCHHAGISVHPISLTYCSDNCPWIVNRTSNRVKATDHMFETHAQLCYSNVLQKGMPASQFI